jgi:ribosome-associated protein
MIEPIDLVNALGQILHDKKAVNLLALDVRHVSNMTQFFLIAEGNVDRHVQALAQAVVEELEKLSWPVHFVEGMEEGEWIVIDCWDVIIHLFVPELRQKYQLERLWERAEIVDLSIDWHLAPLGKVALS